MKPRSAFPEICLALVVCTGLALIFYRQMIFAGWSYAAPDAQSSANANAPLQASLSQGEFPLWNPYVLSGMPSYASLMAAPYVSPPSLVNRAGNLAERALLPLLHLPAGGRRWDLFLHTILAGLGVYVYLRQSDSKTMPPRCSIGAALFGGVAFEFSIHSLAMTAFSHNTKMMTAAYLPWIIWGTERLLRRRSLRRGALLALLVGLQLLTTHMQMAYYTWLAVALVAVLQAPAAGSQAATAGSQAATAVKGFPTPRTPLSPSSPDPQAVKKRRKYLPFILLLLALALGLALSAILTLPVANFTLYSTRGGGGLPSEQASRWSLWPVEALTFLLPNLFGYGGPTYWGGLTFADFPHYAGGVTAILAVLAAIAWGLRQKDGTSRLSTRLLASPVFFLLALLGLSFLLACGEYLGGLYQVMRAILPLYRSFRAPAQALILAEFSLAALCGLGLQALLNARNGNAEAKVIRGLLIATARSSAAGVLSSLAWGDHARAWLGNQGSGESNPELGAARFQMATGDAPRLAFSLICLGLLTGAYRKKVLSQEMLAVFLIALLVLDLWQAARGLPSPEPPRAASNEAPIVLPCPDPQQQPCLYRVLPAGALFSDNSWGAHGIQNAGGFHAVRLRLYQKFLEHFGLPEQISPRALALLNVGWVVSLQPLELPGLQPAGWLASETAQGQPASQSPSALVYYNTNALPRAWLVAHIRLVEGETAALQMLDSPDFDPAHQAILLQMPSVWPTEGEVSEVVVEDYQLHTLSVRTRADTARLLVLSEVYYPAGWQAFVDGRQTALLQVDYLLRGVALPSGEHVVSLRFEPWDIRLGAGISLAAAALILAGLVWPAAAKLKTGPPLVSRRSNGTGDQALPIPEESPPLLELLVAHLPLPHLLWRTAEWQALRRNSFSPLVLDLGCGDGWFGTMLFPHGAAVGVDVSLEQARQAQQRHVYRHLVVAEAGRLPFCRDCFASLVANSSLEHIADLDAALLEARRTLTPGGGGYLTIPSEGFQPMLCMSTWLSRLGAPRLAAAYASWLNARLHHVQPGDLPYWENCLRLAGFALKRTQALLPRRALWLWELGLPVQYVLRRVNRWLPLYSWSRRIRARWLAKALSSLKMAPGEAGAVWLLEVE